ncbi:ABC transporter permease [Occultella glacieicola]|uniref:ABC transporter permease n=1 Tax=Occultella glacieicola TaxID=2518684 RepID=A0ABY2E7U0_9MICO|nr:ABC transporter permease [Occultella glacieicola]TDE93946.1 ABC transporter permease [Occultella glacieicola]
MTAATATVVPATPTAANGHHLTFGRILRSEWIKFISLRSTVWVAIVTVAVMVGFSLLMGFGMTQIVQNPEAMGGEASLGGTGTVIGTSVAATGYYFGQIVVAVLGVLIITGEYSTGQIKSTLTAVPTRLPVMAAKGAIVALTSFVLGAVGVAISVLVTTPMLSTYDLQVDLSDSASLQSLLGVPLYMTAIALFAFGIGTLLRHAAAGIAAVLGMLLLLPILGTIQVQWIQDISPYLLGAAGERIITGEQVGAVLTPWEGFGVLMIWVVAALVAAAVLLRRRDA